MCKFGNTSVVLNGTWRTELFSFEFFSVWVFRWRTSTSVEVWIKWFFFQSLSLSWRKLLDDDPSTRWRSHSSFKTMSYVLFSPNAFCCVQGARFCSISLRSVNLSDLTFFPEPQREKSAIMCICCQHSSAQNRLLTHSVTLPSRLV